MKNKQAKRENLHDILERWSKKLGDSCFDVKEGKDMLYQQTKDFLKEMHNGLKKAPHNEIVEVSGRFDGLIEMYENLHKELETIDRSEVEKQVAERMKENVNQEKKEWQVKNEIVGEQLQTKENVGFTIEHIKGLQGDLKKASRSVVGHFNSFTQWIKDHASKSEKLNDNEVKEASKHIVQCSKGIDQQELVGQSKDDLTTVQDASAKLRESYDELWSVIPDNKDGQELEAKAKTFKEKLVNFANKVKQAFSGEKNLSKDGLKVSV